MSRRSNNSQLSIESFFITLLVLFGVTGILLKTGEIQYSDVQQANPFNQPQVQFY